ncbi:MAG: DUF2029 domain-containing protein [Candidatus Dormibacteraeota bacterium]|nr:DUF2029 domain-containing protein [Candidatus Dormibacteraeota bacterium]
MSSRPSTLPAGPAGLARGKVRAPLLLQAALVAAALTLYALVLGQATQRHEDYNAYLKAAQDFLGGQPLYTTFLQHPFPDPTLRPAYIYPPAFALLFAPFALLPGWVGAVSWLLICQVALTATLVVVLRAERATSWAVTALLCLTFTFYPLWVDAVQGQANLPILLLVTAGIVGVVRGRPAWAAAIGTAAALKLTPLLLLAWLLAERRFRAAAWLVVGFALVTAAGALVRFDDTITFFTRVLPALGGGTAFYANQSVAGLVGRVLAKNPYTDPWLALPGEGLLVAAVAALLCAFWVWRRRRVSPLAAALAFLPLLPLLSAVTWPHHLVILLPVIWLSVIALERRGWPLAPTLTLAGLTLVMSLVARWPTVPAFGAPGFRAAQTMDPLVFVVVNSLAIATLVFFLGAPWLLRSR